MKKRFVFPICCCLLLLALACNDQTPDSPIGQTTNDLSSLPDVKDIAADTITLKVNDLSNPRQGIGSVAVSEIVQGNGVDRGQTATNGTISIYVTPSSRFKLIKTGYQEMTIAFDDPTSLNTLEVFLKPSYSSVATGPVVIGTVTDNAGNKIRGVEVTNNVTQTVLTGMDGSFVINSALPPPFTLNFHKGDISTTLGITAVDTGIVSIELDGITIFDTLALKITTPVDSIKSKE